MGWNGSGTLNRTDGTRSGTQVWQDADAAGIKIRADDHDTHDQDLADAIENTVALDGQTTTTTDNAILRYDTGNSKFEGVTISASQLVGRSAAGDTRGMSAATARQTIGVGTAVSTNGKILQYSSANSQYIEFNGFGTASPTNDKMWVFASASSQYEQTSFTATDVANVSGVITTEGDLMLGDGSGDESRLAIGSANRVLRSNGTTASWGQVVSNDVATDTLGAANIAAGAIGQSEVANSAIGQGELKTAREDQSTSSTTYVNVILINNEYAFAPQFGNSTQLANASFQTVEFTYSEKIDGQTFQFKTTDNSHNAITRQRYFQASPPYDLGDGECGLFVTLDVLSDGSILSTRIAPDPVWALRGPTDIRPDRTDKKTGKKYKSVRRPALTREDLINGRCSANEYIAAQKEAVIEEIEITPEYKNADMDIYPHTWPAPQGTVCMLDPVNTHDLLMLHEAGEDVADLIHRGYIQIGDKVNRKGPSGVTPVSWKWK